MKKSSWYAFGLVVILSVCIAVTYAFSQRRPATFDETDAHNMIRRMQSAVANKDVGGLMRFVSENPNTKVAGASYDQLKLYLNRAFHDSSRLTANVDSFRFTKSDTEAIVEFQLRVVHNDGAAEAEDYSGKITLHVRPVTVSFMMGLYKTDEWRVVSAETTGPAPGDFGDGS